MRTTLKLALLALVALAISTYLTRLTRACNPGAFMPEAIFINLMHPDLPIAPYTMGNLGVVQPTYASIYLYVAYRNLTGPPFSPSDELALWDRDEELLTGHRSWPAQALQGQQAGSHSDWEHAWFSAIGEAEPQVPRSFLSSFGYQPWAGVYREISLHEFGSTFYSQFLNCPQEAFQQALSTYNARVARFGASSPIVQSWVEAQEDVFGNCSSGHVIPDPLPPSDPPLARADRGYQIAAAHFYAGDYGEAASEFRTIAQDQSSPWRTVAPYLVARSLVRKATTVASAKPDFGTLAQAEAQVESVLSKPGLAKYHHTAEQLRGFIQFQLHPRGRLVELANNLTEFSGDRNLAQDATDFTLLVPRVQERFPSTIPPPISSDRYAALAGVRAKSDLLDWIFTLRLSGADAYSHSLAKWQSTHSEAWLVAALTKALPDSPEVPALVAAAQRVSLQSRAYDSVTFQSLRLLLLQGKVSEVRERLARLRIHHLGPYPEGYTTPPSTANLFLALRFALAQNLSELFANAPRVPATITSENSSRQLPQPIWLPAGENPFDPSAARFDDDALMVLNRFVPVTILSEAVHSPNLPENLRREIALTAWTRAVLLGDPTVARSLAPAVETFKPSLAASLQAYNSALTPAARRFAAALAVLRFPGLRPFITTPERATPIGQIDEYRDNWWGTVGPVCAPPNPNSGRFGYPPPPRWPPVKPWMLAIYPKGEVEPPAFLTAAERAEAADEWKRLIAIGTGPDYLSKEVVEWGRGHPSDPRVPEALALAVKSTRFGCQDQETGELSKAAFDLLHSRYPNSSWAQKTEYWFKM
jgi:hypothetical protein